MSPRRRGEELGFGAEPLGDEGRAARLKQGVVRRRRIVGEVGIEVVNEQEERLAADASGPRESGIRGLAGIAVPAVGHPAGVKIIVLEASGQSRPRLEELDVDDDAVL